MRISDWSSDVCSSDLLAQAVAECDQFRAVGREREPIHFSVLAGELEDVVKDRIRDVLDGPGLAVVERGELFNRPRIVQLVIAARHARTDPSCRRSSPTSSPRENTNAPSPPPTHPPLGPKEQTSAPH